MAPHEYEFLAPDDVRLMKLLPGDHEDPLMCEFVSIGMDDCPDYEALSYVWGSVDHLEEIKCHGAVVNITNNLAQGLRAVRHKHQTQMLWADQLCINQADLTERSTQVGMMGRIFKNASQVVMWLGADEGPNPLAPLCVDLMSQMAAVSGQEHPLHVGLVTDELLISCGLPGIEAPAWAALRTLFELPYFERLWVYQEVYLARRKMVLWGDTDLDYGHMKTSLDFIKSYQLLWGSNQLFGPLGPRSASCMLDVQKRALHQHLNNVSSFKVTDERDRIYGLLGLVEDQVDTEERNSVLTVDYAEPLIVTFIKATTYVLYTIARVDFLESCGLWLYPLPDTPDIENFWPSWVPKWQGGRPSLRSGSTHGASHELLVDRKIATQRFAKIQLRLAGHTVAHVAHVAPVLQQLDFSVSAEFWRPLKIAWELCREHLTPARNWKEVFKTCICAHSLCDLSGFNERPDRKTPMLYELAMSMAVSVIRMLQNGSLISDQLDDFFQLAYIAAAIHEPCQTTMLGSSVDEIDQFVREWRADRLQRISQGRTNANEQTLAVLRKDLKDALSDPDVLEEVATSIMTLMSLYETGTSLHAAWIPFPNSYFATLKDRRFFITDDGHIGVGPHNLQPGNPVVILHGAKVPHVLERVKDSHYLLGPCYLEGVMEGQYIQRLIDEGGMEKVHTTTEYFDLA